MPPGRRRKGLGRIDAAIDAMLPLGFTVKQVRKCVKELLKEYGGDEGWPFIEDASYSELIAAILRDVEKENQEEAAQDGNPNTIMQDQLKDKFVNEELSITHNKASDAEKSPANTAAVAEAELDGKGWSDDLSTQTSVTKNNETPWTKVDSSKNQSGRLLPCYGWIKDDDELKDKCNGEEEASMNTVAVAESVVDGKGWKGIFSDQTSVLPVNKNNEEPPTKVRIGSRRPCYGWIEDDKEEDDDDFITLQPSSMVLGPPKSDA